ncbi:PTS system, galactitol-specific IIA component [Lentibacillus persicus]|uniref:PTS system, galactitol-specific IIA component n=1 Tax=Lentibacillus persicus TaxID=640948 RepID=A0A1I1SBI5_9BACI|nr:PTS sugar transporter subunit IIA [Lentibacillus persicus]SFD43884.1 PTS system, galactitol-specific IIA component [Lentibacillus persicus]
MNNSEIQILKLDVSTDKEALKYMGDFLVFQGVTVKAFPEKVIEREATLPTGLPVQSIGVAVPHTDSTYVKKRQLLISPLKTPVVFRQMGDTEQEVNVSFVFMPAIPDAGEHLTLLRQLFTCFEDNQFTEALINWDGKKSSLKRLIQRNVDG